MMTRFPCCSPDCLGCQDGTGCDRATPWVLAAEDARRRGRDAVERHREERHAMRVALLRREQAMRVAPLSERAVALRELVRARAAA